MKFIDLFAGVGGFRLSLEKHGAKCVFSSEIDKFARETYHANFKEYPTGDITKVDIATIPPFDRLCAGFPCQPFSITGLRHGFNDTRGTLFFHILEIAKHHLPPVLFLENVKGLLGHDKGRTFSTIKRELEKIGYFVNYKVLNAYDFGTPQKRERIFIVATRSSKPFNFPTSQRKQTRKKPGAFHFTELAEKTIKLGDFLEKVVDVDRYTLSDKSWEGLKRRQVQDRYSGFGYRLHTEETTAVGTILTTYSSSGVILLEQQGRNPRRLTPRELARLQGYPDTFKLPCSDSQTYKQIGNSLPIPVVERISKNIVEYLGEVKNK